MEPEAPEASATPAPAPAPAQAPASETAVPSLSEKHSWYDGPSAADATSETPGQDDGAPPQHGEPDADDRGGREPTKGKSAEQNLLMDGIEAKRALARVYADFKSDGFQVDKSGKSAIDAVTKLIDKALDDARGGSELNHQDLRDSIVRHGVDALKNAHEAAAKNQRDVWNKFNDGWKTESRNDPQIGGARLERSLAAAKGVIEEFGGSPAQQKALMAHLNNNGMGNYAGFIRLLANIADKMNVFEDFHASDGAGPSGRGQGQRGAPGSGRAGWYNNSNGGA